MSKRLRLRFGIRTLLVLVTATAALFGYESYISLREESAVAAIERLGGTVEYEFVRPEWLRKLAGPNYGRRVHHAYLEARNLTEAIPHCIELRSLEAILIWAPQDPRPADLIARYTDLEQAAASLGAARPDLDELRFHEAIANIGRFDEPSYGRIFVRKLIQECPVSTQKGRLARETLECTLSWPEIHGVVILVNTRPLEFGLLVVLDEASSQPALDCESIVCLLSNGRLIDCLTWDARRTRLEYVDLGRIDRWGIGFLESVSPNVASRSKQPSDPLWLAAYEITPSGFKSLSTGPAATTSH